MAAFSDELALLAGRVEELASAVPHLIGIRHHSPALAAAMPALLEAADPDAILIELPTEAGPWIEHIAAPDAVAPLALVMSGPSGGEGFYPFADFSPELAALRWAREHAVPVLPIDLPVSQRVEGRDEGEATPDDAAPSTDHQAGAQVDLEELWDVAVEAHAYGSDPQALRRAGLAVGFRQRESEGTPDLANAQREAWMRAQIASCTAHRPVVIVGAYHAPALVNCANGAVTAARTPAGAAPGAASTLAPDGAPLPAGQPSRATADVEPPGAQVALIGYEFALLDSRSGYPAGIRDPAWQQAVLEAGSNPHLVSRAATTMIAAVCAQLRADGHAAGTADVLAAEQLMRGLAVLRGLPAPGRRELIEAMQSVLAQGEPLGRARAVAKAAQRVLVGERRGHPGAGAPRSGLAVQVPVLLEELGLPHPGNPASQQLRLDPLRSPLDQRRELTLQRMRIVDPGYAHTAEVAGTGGAAALSTRWEAAWTPMTAAMVERHGSYGVGLPEAVTGLLSSRWRHAADGPLVDLTGLLERAAHCGLAPLVSAWTAALVPDAAARGSLGDLLALYHLLTRIDGGQVPGLVGVQVRGYLPDVLGAALTALTGLGGAATPQDARALVELVHLVAQDPAGAELGRGQLVWRLRQLAGEPSRGRAGMIQGGAAPGNGRQPSSPLAQGAASAALVTLDERPAPWLAVRLSGWLDDCVGVPPGPDNAQRLTGALIAAQTLLEGSPELLQALRETVLTWSDAEFFRRLPTARGGFAWLTPATRARLLAALGVARVPARGHAQDDPELLARWAAADLAGRQAVAATMGDAIGVGDFGGRADISGVGEVGSAQLADNATALGTASGTEMLADHHTADALGEADRWRLILAQQTSRLPPHARRMATALDELYGAGRGEGATWLDDGGAGQGPGYVSVREWEAELDALFGPTVREEVLASAATAGRVDALTHLEDQGRVTASVDVLEQVLSLAGALPEEQLGSLRALARRMIDQLVGQLAQQLSPALAGLATPRPTRRPGGPLDLGRTVQRNLRYTQLIDGRAAVIPRHPVFSTRTRRTAAWDIYIVVDVSGSMERSVIYSALIAAVLHAVPALSVHLITFSDEVVDMTGRVSDPLSLLLEIHVGGGTLIGQALGYVRQVVEVPGRSIVAVVSDFEDGGPLDVLLGHTRALSESGVHLLGLAAVDGGQGVYNAALAGQLVAAGMPVAALSPLEVAEWVGRQVRGGGR